MITLKKIHHRGADRLGIFFDFNQTIIDQIKSLPNRKYSNTNKCWYLPYDHVHLTAIVNLNYPMNLNLLDDEILLPKPDYLPKGETIISQWQKNRIMKINDVSTIDIVVQESDTAQDMGSNLQGEFPAVLATPKMIALMEYSAAQIIEPQLTEGQLSVGVGVNIQHMAATPVGEKVSVKAKFMGMEGKLYKFEVTASDRAGIVGKGFHTRAIVDVSRIMIGAKKRYQSIS